MTRRNNCKICGKYSGKSDTCKVCKEKFPYKEAKSKEQGGSGKSFNRLKEYIKAKKKERQLTSALIGRKEKTNGK